MCFNRCGSFPFGINNSQWCPFTRSSCGGFGRRCGCGCGWGCGYRRSCCPCFPIRCRRTWCGPYQFIF